MDKQTQTELEAAAFRTLLGHLSKRSDVQNIDLMNLSGFCRNCLAKWYMGAAKQNGIEMEYADAQEHIYGMPYAEWKQQYQKEASPEQLARFNALTKEDITE